MTRSNKYNKRSERLKKFFIKEIKMAVEKLRNAPFYVMLDTDRDSFGIESGFTMEIQDEVGNVLTNNATGTWSEVIRTSFAANTGEVASAADVGDRIISLTTGHTIAAGDVVTIGSAGTYAVVAVDGDNIELKRGLEAPVSATDSVTAVGNTGIYKADVELDFSGDVTVMAHHPEYGYVTIRYTMVDTNLDMVDEKIDNISAAIGATKTIRAVI
jgi:hypothetical protein